MQAGLALKLVDPMIGGRYMLDHALLAVTWKMGVKQTRFWHQQFIIRGPRFGGDD